MAIEHYDILLPIALALRHHETYVELGVSDGATFNRIAPFFDRRIAVDIRDDLGHFLMQPSEYVVGPTDSFFLTHPDLKNVDFIFLDADHRADFVRRDAHNAIKMLRPYDGILAMHDTCPLNEAGIAGGSWTAWEIAQELRSTTDIEVLTLPVHMGITLVRYIPNGFHMAWQA